jgi:LytS/YehU family sensor histidine kinase
MMVAVENAVKHNEVSKSNRLMVDIECNGSILTIKNKLQERKLTKDSTKTGLQNLDERFTKIIGKGINIIKDNHYFILQMPLLKLNQ